jgi:aminoglycoside 6'-N-acetyltransferase
LIDPLNHAVLSVAFRPLMTADLPQLCAWFAEPAVARWWNMPAAMDAVTEKYGPRIAGVEPTRMWIVEIEGMSAGLLQSYWHCDYPTHDAAVGIAGAVGVDYLIGESHRGRGFGSRVLGDFAAFVLEEYPDASEVVATPAQDNEASWRALEAAGFRRVGECQPPHEPPAFAYAFDRGTSPTSNRQRS